MTASPRNRRSAAVWSTRAAGVGAILTLGIVSAAGPASASTPTTAHPTASGTTWQALEDTAKKNGHVAVVVSLRAPGAAQERTARDRHFIGERDHLLGRFGHRPTGFKGLDGAPFVALHATLDELRVLESSTDIQAVSVDHAVQLEGTSPFGVAAGSQLPQFWDYTQVGADWANNNGYTGKGMKVVIIDTGVDRTNPYLAGKVVNEACFATNQDGSGACPNGSTTQYSTAKAGVAGAAAPCSFSYGCAHGTHVAHTAAGMYGVARGATIVAVRAASPFYDTQKAAWVPNFNVSDIANALWYAHDILPKAGIIPAAVNMSIGNASTGSAGYCDDPNSWVTYEINVLKSDYQVPTVVSSGNDNLSNTVSWPACNSNAISVGNTTKTAVNGIDAVFGNVDIGSNTAATLDLLAPGTDICSAVPKTLDNDGTADGWSCGWIGTSMAAPHVTGALAVITQKWPNATVDQMLQALKRSGSTGGVAVNDSRNTSITRTRINVANVLYYGL